MKPAVIIKTATDQVMKWYPSYAAAQRALTKVFDKDYHVESWKEFYGSEPPSKEGGTPSA